MSRTIEAIYENGVLKPLDPVDLPDGIRVHIAVEPSTSDLEEQVRQQLLSEGALPQSIEKALATLRQLRQCFEGLTEEQSRILEEARLDQINFFNRPED
ncbi:MAG: antitoxin family protein [Acidobacteriota bacterium]|nr:antitoxin family protein [Blastocatellia bacterium]MDW8241463.1 antitoxin family protein [Acidobacteriota bacterium]